MNIPRLLVSAAHKSSGKTTITLGLAAALGDRGEIVQPFKKGPDYIDPMWLSLAAGRNCFNLDFFTMERDEILATVASRSGGSSLALIEGNKGLYDGLDLDGSNSNAALARLLSAPVILVIDARGMTRGIAPLILGYQSFDPEIRIAGVILNQLGGNRHEAKLRAVIEHYTDVPVVGAVHRDKQLEIVERHLGLIPSNEDQGPGAKIRTIGERIAEQVDLQRIRGLANSASSLPTAIPPAPTVAPGSPIRIGIARDEAFGFYYPDDLDALAMAGVQLVPVNTLSDSRLPPLDGLFIGGGFPETRMRELDSNSTLRTDIRRAIEGGLPVYAECGGLMYLARSITWRDRRATMVGAIPADIVMHERPQGRGYVKLEETEHMPWPGAGKGAVKVIAGHEFHYSSLVNVDESLHFAYRVRRGTGIDGVHDGILVNNLLACYSHQRNTAGNPWIGRFVEFVRGEQRRNAPKLSSHSRK